MTPSVGLALAVGKGKPLGSLQPETGLQPPGCARRLMVGLLGIILGVGWWGGL